MAAIEKSVGVGAPIGTAPAVGVKLGDGFSVLGTGEAAAAAR